MPIKSACCLLLPVLLGGALVAQGQNPVFRANRGFYTSMWTANPPEYTTTGQVVAGGTMHWRAFIDQANQRREPRQINGIGTWWQPSDLAGTFPQTIPTPEFRIYPTTTDAAGLMIPDLAATPLLTVPPIPLTANSGGALFSVTIALSVPAAVNATDFAICGVYPQGASSTAPGHFSFMPSAANEAHTLRQQPQPQSYYGFAYPNGQVTHFGLGGARSSLWYTEAQPTLSLRGNWAVSDAHHQTSGTANAFGDQTYFAPLADATWPGWADSRQNTRVGLTVFALGNEGALPLTLFNFGPRFTSGLPFIGQMFELDLTSPVLGSFLQIAPTITNGRSDIDIPLFNVPQARLAGTYIGFESLLLDPLTFQFIGSTQSAWLRL
jgi:hypothetical protein